MECPADERSTSGATTRTSPNAAALSASAAMPGLYTPSSLVIRIRMRPRCPSRSTIARVRPCTASLVWFAAPAGGSKKMRVALIHNADAGDEHQPNGERLCAMIREAGHAVSYHHAHDESWQAAFDEGCDLIAAAGGDGTIGRVARKMAGDPKPLAILPMGTANNISRTLGIADLPLAELIAGWQRGFVRNFEVGIARGPFGERRFVEGVGAGVFAWTIPEADASGTLESLTQTEHKITYALQMLKDRLERCPPVKLTATLDGDDVSGEYVLFEAMITRYIGPNLYLAPESATGDG